MSFKPGYGETPLPFEELDVLLPQVRASLSEPITKTMVYDLEQAIEAEVTEVLLTAAISGRLELGELLTDRYLARIVPIPIRRHLDVGQVSTAYTFTTSAF